MPDDLQTLGGLAGLGQGLAAGANMALNHGLAIREQNMKLRISSAQIGLGLKKLAQEIREKDAQHKRFYDGLRHEDLMRTRDNKARKQLQQMVNDHDLEKQGIRLDWQTEENEIAGAREEELALLRSDTQKTVANIQAVAPRRRNELLEQSQRWAQVPVTMSKAKAYLISNLETEDGELSPATVEARAKELGFVDATGRGNSQLYMAQLHEEFAAATKMELGSDAPPVSFSNFMGIAHGVVKGDQRAIKIAMDDMTVQTMRDTWSSGSKQAKNLINVGLDGYSKVPFQLTADGDFQLTGPDAIAMERIANEYSEKYKQVKNGTSGTVEEFMGSLNEALFEATDGRMQMFGMEGAPKGNMSPDELFLFQQYWEHPESGRAPMPFNIHPYPDDTSAKFNMMLNQSDQMLGTDPSIVGDLPAGTTGMDVRSTGTFQTKVTGAIVGARQAYARHMQAGDIVGMQQEQEAAKEEYDSLVLQVTKMPAAARNETTMAMLDQYRQLLDNMTIRTSELMSQQDNTETQQATQQIIETVGQPLESVSPPLGDE